jgi:hypothetical protein
MLLGGVCQHLGFYGLCFPFVFSFSFILDLVSVRVVLWSYVVARLNGEVKYVDLLIPVIVRSETNPSKCKVIGPCLRKSGWSHVPSEAFSKQVCLSTILTKDFDFGDFVGGVVRSSQNHRISIARIQHALLRKKERFDIRNIQPR